MKATEPLSVCMECFGWVDDGKGVEWWFGVAWRDETDQRRKTYNDENGVLARDRNNRMFTCHIVAMLKYTRQRKNTHTDNTPIRIDGFVFLCICDFLCICVFVFVLL